MVGVPAALAAVSDGCGALDRLMNTHMGSYARAHCASREHILIVRTLRAKGTIQGTLPLVFNNLLELVLCHAIPERVAGDFEESACFGDVAACAL